MPEGAEAQSDDGWTKVGKGKGRAPKYVAGIAAPVAGLTQGQLQNDLKAKITTWRRSSCRKAVIAILNSKQPDQGWRLTKAVCLATNSFSRDNFYARQRSMHQLVAFLDIVQHLQAKKREPITLFAQEPNYTTLDVRLLESLHIRVLNSDRTETDSDSLGEAAEHISKSTFVFEPFMDTKPGQLQTFLDADPSLYIGSSMYLSAEQNKKAGTLVVAAEKLLADGELRQQREKGRLAAQFLEGRDSYRFPRFEEDPNIFDGLFITWKAPVDEESEDRMEASPR